MLSSRRSRKCFKEKFFGCGDVIWTSDSKSTYQNFCAAVAQLGGS
jgi:hypothetical protein